MTAENKYKKAIYVIVKASPDKKNVVLKDL